MTPMSFYTKCLLSPWASSAGCAPAVAPRGGPQGSIDIEITGPHTWEQIS
jgi:hypothetical protein